MALVGFGASRVNATLDTLIIFVCIENMAAYCHQ